MLVASLFTAVISSYLSALIMAAGLFGLCQARPAIRCSLLERIGSTYSFFVYIGHALMIHVFNAILPVGDSLLLAWTRPVLLAAATIGCAALWYDVIRRK